MKIRKVQAADVSDILEIYAPFVINSHVSFELEVPSLTTMQERISGIATNYPYLVMEEDNRALGYAYATRFRERKAYDACAETSIYLHPTLRGKGFGKQLYEALFEELQKMNITRLFAVITLPNDSSLAFHESCGFQQFGRSRETGFKLDKWWDIAWLQKLIPADSRNA